MPVKKINTKDHPIPRSQRNRPSIVASTPEWKDFEAILAHGLKPAEAIEITFPPKTVAQAKSPKVFARLFRMKAEAKIQELGLEYDVKQVSQKDGQMSIFVCGRMPNFA
jgi:hypothetical protein